MFWGLTLDPAKRYAKVVDNAFHISAAVLDTTSASDDEIIRVFVEVEGYETLLCNLSKKLGILQFPLDLQFMEGSRIAFYTQGGKGVVHLSGYVVPDVDADDLDEEDLDMEEEESDEEAPELVPINKKRKKEATGKENPKKAKLALGSEEFMDGENDDDDDDSDEEGEEEEESDDGEEEEDLGDEEDDDLEEEEEGDDDDDDDEEDEDDDDDDDDEMDDEELLKKMQEALLSKKDKTPKAKDNQMKGKQNGNPVKTPQKAEKTPKKEAGKADKTPKKEGGKADKTPKKGEVTMNGTAKGETPKKAPNTPGSLEGKGKGTPVAKPKTEVKVGGVKVMDTMVGKGKMAKKGNSVFVYYTGRLQNGKVFDKCVNGRGFHFRLGANEVIKGWDTGLDGMQVGGKRKLICPPKMAYGASGAPPDIPPNATLTFDVELRDVK